MQLDASLQLQAGSSLTPGRAADDALLILLASMACSDGEVHSKELDFLVKVRPRLSRDEVEAWALRHAVAIDVRAIARVVTNPDDRWKTLRFAARMAWKDGELADEEHDLLARLASVLELPDGAVERVLGEMSPDDGQRFTPERLLQTLMGIHWDAVQLASGELCSEDLHAVTPSTTEVVARVGLEKVEVLALCTDGVVARFQEGAAFLGWNELVTYTRERALGSSMRLHTEDGRSFGLVDQRLSGLSVFLDRLLDLTDGKRNPKGRLPKIDTLRGED